MKPSQLRHLLSAEASGIAEVDNKIFENLINEEIWLTAKEAAGFLRISVESLRNMTSNGKIPHYKLGRRVRYLKSELRALLKANKRGA